MIYNSQMLQEISTATLNEYVTLNEYTFDSSIYCQDTGIYTIRYIKKINGRNSSDTAFVMLRQDGETIGVGVPHPGLFDALEIPAVSDDTIQHYVNSIYPSAISCTVESSSYVISDSGELQLAICLAIQESEDFFMNLVYMPL